jgi:geranylgeranyl reductase family protein
LIDVIVVGGGPAGLQAARCLAAEGFDVEVLEEHWSTGEPVHCTGILAPEIFRRFSMPPAAALNELRKIRVHSPKGQVIAYQTDHAEALIVDRSAFDRTLRDLASAGGARICMGIKAAGIEVGGARAVVHCADGSRREARACVLATGSAYTLHQDLEIGFPPVFLTCAQAELPALRPGDVEVFLGKEVAPKGFAWIVPVQRTEGSFARIGLMCDGDAAKYFNNLLPRLEGWALQSICGLRPRQRMLPLAPIRKTYKDRLLVVGDAAGFVKPATGGGVYYGMISAEIAAAVLADALRRDRLEERELSVYQQRWQDRLMEEIEAQLTLRLLLQRLTDDELESIFDLWATDGLMPLVRNTAAFNHHRKLVIAMIRHPAMRKILFRKALTQVY